MPDASFIQPSFLGGEWSPYAQGRLDNKAYRTAMVVCYNTIPVEEGAAVRRPGTAFICTTRSGAFGRVMPFDFTDVAPFAIELTAGHVRVLVGRSLVFDTAFTVVDISTENPAVVTVNGADAWSTNDQVQFLFQSATNVADSAILRNRQFKITVLNATQFTIADPITGVAVDGADINWDPSQVAAQVARVRDLVVPYTEPELQSVRRVQAAGVSINDDSVAILLQGKHQPQMITADLSETAPNFSGFTVGPLAFVDGPYLDAPSGAALTPSGTTGTINFQIGYGSWSSSQSYVIGDFVSFGGNAYQSLIDANLNQQPDTHPAAWAQCNAGGAVGRNGFQAGDVGRLIRVLSEPAEWSAGASYAAGNAVKWNNAYYVAQDASSGAEPDISLGDWLPTTSSSVACWCWGQITAVVTSSEVSVVLLGDQQSLLYNLPISVWMVGVYSDAAGWPTCGQWYEGRLWLGGVVPNRFDASVSNDPFNFSPTAPDGTVGDANGISEEFNSDDQNTLYWMEPTSSGLLCGTKKGEWLISASNQNDPITPTSVQAHRVTKVGCFNQVPAHTPLTMVIIQRFSRLLFEIFPDLFSGKVTAPNLNTFSKHLTKAGVAELAYQSELAPIVWARNNDGSLVGWTYRRTSAQSSVEPEFVGGHRHVLGSGRTVVSLCVNPSPDETSDAPLMVTVDAASGVHHVEQMTALLDPDEALTSAWFVDDATTPSGISVTTLEGVQSEVTFYGLWHLNGKTVSAVCGGLDLGDYLVTDGKITVPFKSDPGKFFTLEYMQSLNASTYGDLATPLDSTVSTTPGQSIQPQVINQFSMPNTPVTGASTVNLKLDYANGNAFLVGDNGFRVISLTNFQQSSAGTLAQITASGPGYTPDLAWDWAHGTDGYLYFRAVGGNQSPWMKVDPATWTTVAQFGTNNNFWSGGPTGLGAPDSMVTLFGGANYVVGCCQRSAFSRQIAWVNADTFTWVPGSTFNIEDGFKGLVCAGPQSSLGATAYVISTPNTLNSFPPHTTLYQTSVDALGNVTTLAIATINASDIDPNWTNFDGVFGFMRDSKDGQLIFQVTTNNTGYPAGVPTAYIVKVRASDGKVLWASSATALPGDGMKYSRITGGVASWIGESSSPGVRVLHTLNTVTGQINTVSPGLANVIPSGFQISDDVNGVLILPCAYVETVNSPRPGPTSTSAFSGWSSLTVGNLFFGNTSSSSRYTIPAVIGFTYTSKGQIVRPALPQETGSANGPANSKTRRNHMFSCLLAAAIFATVKFGTTFDKLRPGNFKTAGGRDYDTKTLFSGPHWSTIEDNYDFEGSLAWQIDRPLPLSIVTIGGFINTQDR